MNTIRQTGYTLLSVPAADIQPLLLLEKTGKGSAQSLNAGIEDLFHREKEDMAVPAVSGDIELPETISDTEDLDLKVDANFNLLKSIIKFFSGSLKADLSVNRSRTVQFKLDNPLKNTVNIVKLNSYLSGAALTPGNEMYLDRIKNGEVYVITEILKAKSFSLKDDHDSNINASAEISAKPVGEAAANLERKKDKNSLMDHAGTADITFGIKAQQLLYKEGKFTLKNTDELEVVREGKFDSRELTGDEGVISIGN